jgi:hypothetical protein
MDLKQYTGSIRFGDASIHINAEANLGRGYNPEREAWEVKYKRDVFKRIVQQLNRLGWTCAIPEEYIKNYQMSFARNYRECRKGDVHGKLEIIGQQIKFEMWQNVNVPKSEREDGRGQFLYNKEKYAPYPLLLEMKRTRNRIRKYLENVCSFKFEPKKPSQMEVGPNQLTAYEFIKARWEDCWHYKPELGRRDGEEYEWNSKSADNGSLHHDMPVWFYDRKGRLNKGTAYYNINNMWWVISGKYGCRNLCCRDLYIDLPNDPRVKNNADKRARAINNELGQAISAENYERAIVLRDLKRKDDQAHVV